MKQFIRLLRGVITDGKGGNNDGTNWIADLWEANASLAKENEVLREALRKIKDMAPGKWEFGFEGMFKECKSIATEALNSFNDKTESKWIVKGK